MARTSIAAVAAAVTGLLLLPTSGLAQEQGSRKSHVKVLSDHPGSATALTARQRIEIRGFLAKSQGKENLICTAASLAGQRESMYPVVLRRAELVCDYAISLNPNLRISVQEKRTQATRFNGRVVLVSR